MENARAGEDNFPEVSHRWHMKKDGRIFIMYGPERAIRERAAQDGYTDVMRSGEYVRSRNVITNAKDGPVVIIDGRKTSKQP